MRRDLEMQASDRGLREFIPGRAASPELRQRARGRIQPLVARLVARAQAADWFRPDVGEAGIEVILAMAGALTDASLHVDPGLWRRYLAMVLDGIQQGDRHDEIPGMPPAQPELARILAGWIPPRRGQG